MRLRERLFKTYINIGKEEAEWLAGFNPGLNPVRVHPPRERVPEVLDLTIRGLLEVQTKWFGIQNISPTISFEIQRAARNSVSIQYLLPTKRLERKLRTQLQNEVPDIKFSDGSTGLPMTEGESVGGGYLILKRPDYYPLRTEFDQPPMNSVVSLLHRDAMRDTKIMIQILLKPAAGQPFRNWWWAYQAYKQSNNLRKEKEKLWGNRLPTPHEKAQADAIEAKTTSPRFHVAVRFLIVGAGEHTPSRVKEMIGGFNVYSNLKTGQYLSFNTVTGIREDPIRRFCYSISNRDFTGSLRFQASLPEVAGLVSIPDRTQRNLTGGQQ